MRVYFLRHASAGSHLAKPKADEQRPLDPDGVRQCGYVGRALAALGVHPEVVISSPLKRALQTATLVSQELGYEAKIVRAGALRPEGSYQQFREMLREYSRYDSVMVVGHNPSETEFLERSISRRGSRARVELRKGGVAAVELDRTGGSLRWYLTPKIARALYEAATAKSRPKAARK